MARKIDRRVERTRKLLKDSFLSLIMEDGYDEISIQHITEKANLGRATFYLHYQDKEELLIDVMKQFIEEFVSQSPQFIEIQWKMSDPKPFIKLFEYADQHYDLFRIMTFSKGSATAARQIQHVLADNITRCIQAEIEKTGANPILPVDYIANYHAGSLLAIIYWWLDADQPFTPHQMAEMYLTINRTSREHLLMPPEMPVEAENKTKDRRVDNDKKKPVDAKKDEKKPDSKPDKKEPVANSAKPKPQKPAKKDETPQESTPNAPVEENHEKTNE